MPESRPPIDLQGVSIAELERLIAAERLPPVHKWDPAPCGHSRMRIDREGRWFHEGRPIERESMVRLFSTILRREPDGSHVLVTPVEKMTIDVERTPFFVTSMTSEGTGERRQIAFALRGGEVVILGADHPLLVPAEEPDRSPRLLVRGGLEAILARPVYYELAQIAVDEGNDPPGVWSNGSFFPLDRPT
ncbi:MAG: DUF1285 domain-containing protein [Sphingomicrobium sp.]